MDERQRKIVLLEMVSVAIRDAIENEDVVAATQEFYTMVKFSCRYTIPDVSISEIEEMMTRPLVDSFGQNHQA